MPKPHFVSSLYITNAEGCGADVFISPKLERKPSDIALRAQRIARETPELGITAVGSAHQDSSSTVVHMRGLHPAPCPNRRENSHMATVENAAAELVVKTLATWGIAAVANERTS